jgi:hypothetical protein
VDRQTISLKAESWFTQEANSGKTRQTQEMHRKKQQGGPSFSIESSVTRRNQKVTVWSDDRILYGVR